MGYDTNLKTLVTRIVEIFRKIEIWTFRSFQKIHECEHFQNTCNCGTFQSENEHGDNISNICTKFKYHFTDGRATGFAGHLNLRHQSAKNLRWHSSPNYKIGFDSPPRSGRLIKYSPETEKGKYFRNTIYCISFISFWHSRSYRYCTRNIDCWNRINTVIIREVSDLYAC